MIDTPSISHASLEEKLGQIADDYAQRLHQGDKPDIEEYARQHPDLADLLRRVLPTIHLMNDFSADGSAEAISSSAIQSSRHLGDFRLLREIGRGGMGVVYEAEQLSLGRKVALKVLPFAGTMDPRHLQRFKNEALAAACLDHPHIVDVYGVGCERGVHFYAMRLIEGHTLAEVVAQLRQLKQQTQPLPDSISSVLGNAQPPQAYVEASSPEATEDYRPGDPDPGEQQTTASTQPDRQAALATKGSTFTPAYFRSIAELTRNVAEALDHAHQEGIIHRDIKPSNLMLDARGKVWVTDFGLAHIDSNSNLTLTGDLVGTLRYMSPEQALAKRASLDHRTDIYSLGATLYELLTLQPAFSEEDRQELLRQISVEEPVSPLKINRSIPVDLATIALKAMEKNPADRYPSAKEMGEDLGHYLADRPIRAKRPSLVQRSRKWARRHPLMTWALCWMLLTLVLGGGGTWTYLSLDKAARLEARKQRVTEYLNRAEQLVEAGNRPEAQAVAQRGSDLLADDRGLTHLKQRARDLLIDIELVAKLEAIRSPQQLLVGKSQIEADSESGKEFHDLMIDVDRVRMDSEYRTVFHDLKIDVDELSVEEAARRIQTHKVPVQIALALDHWAVRRKYLLDEERQQPPRRWQHLLAVACLVDLDPWRNQLRKALQDDDNQALLRLADTANLEQLPPASLDELAGALSRAGEKEKAIALLRKAREWYPGDFWLNYNLAVALVDMGYAHLDESIRFHTTVLALRPNNAMLHNNLGIVLLQKGRRSEAIAAFEQAVRIDPRSTRGWINLSYALMPVNRTKARAAAQKALELDPRYAPAWNIIGIVQFRENKLEDAVKSFRQGIAIDNTVAAIWSNMGTILLNQNKPAEAMEAVKTALEMDPEAASAWSILGKCLDAMNKPDEAIVAYRKAYDINPRYPGRARDLVLALQRQERFQELIEVCHDAIQLDLHDFLSYRTLTAILRKHDRDSIAIDAYRKKLRLDPLDVEIWRLLGLTHFDAKRFPEASSVYDEAFALFESSFQDLPHYFWREAGQAYCGAGNLDEGIEAYHQSLKRNPKDPFTYHVLGEAYLAKKQYGDAVATFREVHQRNPNSAECMIELANALLKHAKPDEAIAFYEKALLRRRMSVTLERLFANPHDRTVFLDAINEAIKKEPQNDMHYRLRAHVAAMEGRWQDVENDLTKATEVNPEVLNRAAVEGRTPSAWQRLAWVLAYRREVNRYHTHCNLMLDRFGPTLDPSRQHWPLVKSCLLLSPVLIENRTQFDAIVKRELARKELPDKLGWRTLALGVAELREGNHQSAAALLEQCNARHNLGPHRKLQAKCLLAMVEHRTGNPERARTLLEEAQKILQDKITETPSASWNVWLHSQILYREAEELIQKENPDARRGNVP